MSAVLGTIRMPSAPACRSTTARPGHRGRRSATSGSRLDQAAVAQAYTPLRQTAQGLGGLVPRADDRRPRTATAVIRDGGPLGHYRTCRAESAARRHSRIAIRHTKLTAVLLSGLAGGVLVTMAGITGVIATSVAQRTQEFASRMGARGQPTELTGRWSARGPDSGGPWAGARHDRIDSRRRRVLSTYLFEHERPIR